MGERKGHLREGLWRVLEEKRKLNGQGVSLKKVKLLAIVESYYRLEREAERPRASPPGRNDYC